jgi:hypothetical protein
MGVLARSKTTALQFGGVVPLLQPITTTVPEPWFSKAALFGMSAWFGPRRVAVRTAKIPINLLNSRSISYTDTAKNPDDK